MHVVPPAQAPDLVAEGAANAVAPRVYQVWKGSNVSVAGFCMLLLSLLWIARIFAVCRPETLGLAFSVIRSRKCEFKLLFLFLDKSICLF